ncbi:MAG TPA: alpha/beta hydrolase [Acidobacteriaceae bacterium]|nr:alpha/beta hydrolase [Acidobacteriaceae bacterium]
MDILSLPVLPADQRIPYGPDPSQFGDLWLPETKSHALLPVVVFFHGGWWKSAYGLGYAGYLCAALKREGIAVWSVEYRRVGETGGGWPTTFQDAAAGFDYLSTLAKTYPLDLHRVITMGHSAGGHLAFWIAGRHHIEHDSEVFLPQPQVGLRAAIALAGAVDLRLTIALAGDGVFAHDRDEVMNLIGGAPDDVPKRYAAGNPGDLLPFQAPQILIQGTEDDQIPPELPQRWAALSQGRGSHATVRMISGADHFDVVDPSKEAWKTVAAQVRSSFGM